MEIQFVVVAESWQMAAYGFYFYYISVKKMLPVEDVLVSIDISEKYNIHSDIYIGYYVALSKYMKQSIELFISHHQYFVRYNLC